MKNVCLWLTLLFFGCVSGFGQTTDELYLQQESTRISNATATETLIEDFISQNMSNYSLTQARMSQVTSPVVEGETLTLKGQELQDAITEAKKIELRKLYFAQNPSKTDYYIATPITKSVSSCINSNFTNGTAGFSFASSRTGWSQYQNFPTAAALPTTGGIIELVTDGFDLKTNNILRRVCPTPTPAPGARAIRLNNGNDGNYDVSVLRRQFVVASPTVSFNFALVLQNGHQADPGTQSYFQYRLVDNSVPSTNANYVLVDNHIVCDILDPRFHPGTGTGSTQALYTDWSCQVINTSQYQGKNVTLEILVADCGGSAHFGYAYLDNFCNMNACTNSSFGDINLNPVNAVCPTFPLNVTGTISIPSGSSVTNITLDILDSNNNVVGTLTNPQIVGNNFTFQVNQSNFGTGNLIGNFRFRARAVFTTTSGIPYTVTASLNPNPDVSFNNCIAATIALNPVNENCPLFPLDVTGNFIIPTGATISNIILQVLNSSGVVMSTLSNPLVNGNTFSFPVNQINFGTASPITGDFEFRVSATVSLGSSQTVISKVSANPGADVSFSNCSVCCATCCVDNQSLTSPVLATFDDTRQANLRIQATNTISNGAFASYHAGNYVLLKNGFNASAGSRVHVYNEGCSGTYTLRQINQGTETSNSNTNIKEVNDSNKVELVLNDIKGISIYPNPSSSLVTIYSREEIKSISVISMLGKTMIHKEINNQSNSEFNISFLEKGIYILSVETNNGTKTEKLIKN